MPPYHCAWSSLSPGTACSLCKTTLYTCTSPPCRTATELFPADGGGGGAIPATAAASPLLSFWRGTTLFSLPRQMPRLWVLETHLDTLLSRSLNLEDLPLLTSQEDLLHCTLGPPLPRACLPGREVPASAPACLGPAMPLIG